MCMYASCRFCIVVFAISIKQIPSTAAQRINRYCLKKFTISLKRITVQFPELQIFFLLETTYVLLKHYVGRTKQICGLTSSKTKG